MFLNNIRRKFSKRYYFSVVFMESFCKPPSEKCENMTLNSTMMKPVGNVMLMYRNSHRRTLFLNILGTIREHDFRLNHDETLC